MCRRAHPVFCLVDNFVVNSGTAFGQWRKGVSVGQTPQDDPLYCCYAEFVNVMLQYNRTLFALHTVDHILDD